MNLVINSEDLSFKNLFFNDSIKNNVMTDSSFIRILYSNNSFMLNGIYIKITIVKNNNSLHNIENIYTNNTKIISYIDEIEKYILNKYNNKKLHSYKIKEQLQYLIYKITNNQNQNQNQNQKQKQKQKQNQNDNILNYILKISGIWETQTTIGITNKFISM